MNDPELLMPIEWDPERHGIGIRQIDEQHKLLIDYINQLAGLLTVSLNSVQFNRGLNAVSAPFAEEEKFKAKLEHEVRPGRRKRAFPENFQKGSTIANLVNNLVTYLAKNIASEEQILESYSYPDRATQKAEHAYLTETVCRVHLLVEQYAAEEEDLIELLAFLRLWIREHIPKDRRYAPLLLEKGIGS